MYFFHPNIYIYVYIKATYVLVVVCFPVTSYPPVAPERGPRETKKIKNKKALKIPVQKEHKQKKTKTKANQNNLKFEKVPQGKRTEHKKTQATPKNTRTVEPKVKKKGHN